MCHLDITRTPGRFPNRSGAVVHRLRGGGGTILAPATARDRTARLEAQTEDVLAVIDGYLVAAGTDCSRLLRAEVFMGDLSQKAAMDAAWTGGIPAGEGPVRSAVETPMRSGDLVEIIVTAALLGEAQ